MTEEAHSDHGSGSETRDESTAKTLSRRTALAGIAGLGLLSGVETASANAGTPLELGGDYTGTTSPGLKIAIDSGKAMVGETTSTGNNFDFGLIGRTDSSRGRAVAGFADSPSGNSIGLLGRNSSSEGKGLEGYADSSSGNTIGVSAKVDSSDGRGIYAINRGSGNKPAHGVWGQSQAEGGVGVYGYASDSSGSTYGVKGEVDSGAGWGLYTPNSAKIDGDLKVLGTKNFVQTVSTNAGPKQVTYTAVEAGDPQTEHSDVAEMEDGVAVVDLPDHFGMVTSSEERLTVQVTPYADEKVHPQVTDTSTDRIVVKDFGDGSGDYAFSYTVTGIRQGFEDQNVVRDAE